MIFEASSGFVSLWWLELFVAWSLKTAVGLVGMHVRSLIKYGRE